VELRTKVRSSAREPPHAGAPHPGCGAPRPGAGLRSGACGAPQPPGASYPPRALHRRPRHRALSSARYPGSGAADRAELRAGASASGRHAAAPPRDASTLPREARKVRSTGPGVGSSAPKHRIGRSREEGFSTGPVV
jgi:hypothetical protein